MRNFTDLEIDKWIAYTDKNVLSEEEFLGRCYVCGKFLKDVELPKGSEKKIVCAKDRDYFEEEYKELEDCGDIK
ncbi:hypothetical protein [Macrococcus bovicus]|uniref:hypothetical protein n=1 Tax=Macrococcus bovicus TaxID=69968 RepID=UPI0025A567D5|nr:hypothetical protein [Macrococcus bovicus]WJP96695.1 hypothetical protein QSV55_00010 [Macrococcus bovicus]